MRHTSSWGWDLESHLGTLRGYSYEGVGERERHNVGEYDLEYVPQVLTVEASATNAHTCSPVSSSEKEWHRLISVKCRPESRLQGLEDSSSVMAGRKKYV